MVDRAKSDGQNNSDRIKKLRAQGLVKCRAHAKSKGGKFLSNTYKSKEVNYEWECEFGHRWKAVAETVKNRGHWCAQCGHLFKKRSKSQLTWEQVQEMRHLAKSGNYTISNLAKKYGVHVDTARNIIKMKRRLYS